MFNVYNRKCEFGKIDILVNNAGITADKILLRMEESDWDRVLNINLKGSFNMTKHTTTHMMRKKYGRIVNISSVVALMGNVGQANYVASKAGLIGLTKTVAKEFGGKNITVNAIAPGYIKTAMTDALSEEVRNSMLKMVPLGYLGEVEDIANAVLFLVSPSARYITDSRPPHPISIFLSNIFLNSTFMSTSFCTVVYSDYEKLPIIIILSENLCIL